MMFGIGFTELLLIAIIAILFLGPDKLPEAMVQIAKFFKQIKNTVSEAKQSLEEEIRLDELKKEALGYKQKLDEATEELRNFKNIDFDDTFEELEEEYEEFVETVEEIAKPDTPKEPKPSPYAEAPRTPSKPPSETERKMQPVTLKRKSDTKPKDPTQDPKEA